MKSLGEVDTERFIALIQREPFDYTEWQRNLWEGQSLKKLATRRWNSEENKPNKTLEVE